MSQSYTQFEDADYTSLRRKLLRAKGSEDQRDFLRRVRDEKGLPRLLRETLREVGTRSVPLAPEPLTEDEYGTPPPDTEQRLYRAWSALTPSVACRTTFWTHLTCRHIEAGRIEPDYLAANGNPSVSGAERIDLALHDTTGQADKLVDDCVRTVLRRLGGLREARGNRTVYVDCPFARAWWREHLNRQISGDDAALAEDVRRVFRVSQTYWEKLVDRIVSRNSTFGSIEVRNALVRRLAVDFRDPDSKMHKTSNLVHACRQVSAQQGARELSILDPGELDELLDGVVLPA